ncbi:hypothetical protein DFH09DRAFT_1074923 [Mycena vulgaris]|nr:hypothetical protein DFH09DRAFT_1074923 [Mycena vulgaris]
MGKASSIQGHTLSITLELPTDSHEPWTVRPGDFQRSQSGSSSDKPLFGSGEEGTSSTSAPSGSTNATLVEALYEDIWKRTDIALRTQQFFKDNSIKFREDEDEDVPPLLSELSNTPEHPPINCPLVTLPVSAPVSAPEERPVSEDRTPPVLRELDYERILHDILEVAMVPSLREIVALTGPQMEKYFRLLKSARAVRCGSRELAAGIDVQSDCARNQFVEQFVEEMACDIEEALKEVLELSGNDPDIATDASVDASVFRPSGPIASHLARISHPRKDNPITGSWSSSSDSSSESSEYGPLFQPIDFATGIT